ncbi:MAG: hypothetical protein ACYC2T_01425 [Bacillota bacterium]
MFLLLIVFAAVIAVQAPVLVRQKMWKELAAFSVILLVGMVYSVGVVLELPLPNPVKGLKLVSDPVAVVINNLLK